MTDKAIGDITVDKKKIIGFYDYTVILTYLGMIVAFLGIILAIHENYVYSIVCLMIAGVCDMFDGAVAATKERDRYEKHFGIQIDSLCDLISFGVLPALFVYKISGEQVIYGIICCGYLLCGLIRLAYFNVQEYERQQSTTECRKVYLGVPITTSAIVMPLTYLIYDKVRFVGNIIFPMMLAVLGIGFVSGIEIKKPGTVGKMVMFVTGIIIVVGVFLLSGVHVI